MTANSTKPTPDPKELAMARSLLARFYDGATTPRDEAALYSFFDSYPSLPPDLEEERDAISWFASGISEEAAGCNAAEPPVSSADSLPADNSIGRRVSLRAPSWMRSVGAAAAVAIAAVGLTSTAVDSAELNRNRLAYEGSFIEVDGRRITDIDAILPMLISKEVETQRRADLLASMAENELLSRIDSIHAIVESLR